MAEIEGAIRCQFQSLSIVFVCAVNTKPTLLFGLELSLQTYIELNVEYLHVQPFLIDHKLALSFGHFCWRFCPLKHVTYKNRQNQLTFVYIVATRFITLDKV